MNPPPWNSNDFIYVLIATHQACTCSEASRCLPSEPEPIAHNSLSKRLIEWQLTKRRGYLKKQDIWSGKITAYRLLMIAPLTTPIHIRSKWSPVTGVENTIGLFGGSTWLRQGGPMEQSCEKYYVRGESCGKPDNRIIFGDSFIRPPIKCTTSSPLIREPPKVIFPIAFKVYNYS